MILKSCEVFSVELLLLSPFYPCQNGRTETLTPQGQAGSD